MTWISITTRAQVKKMKGTIARTQAWERREERHASSLYLLSTRKATSDSPARVRLQSTGQGRGPQTGTTWAGVVKPLVHRHANDWRRCDVKLQRGGLWYVVSGMVSGWRREWWGGLLWCKGCYNFWNKLIRMGFQDIPLTWSFGCNCPLRLSDGIVGYMGVEQVEMRNRLSPLPFY